MHRNNNEGWAGPEALRELASKVEPELPQKLLYRRGGRPSHMSGHMTVPMTKQAAGSMALLAAGAAGRRRFSEDDRRRIVEESAQPGCSVSQTARRYGIYPARSALMR
jgi:hypothetical protein